jgi:hypothetical protein
MEATISRQRGFEAAHRVSVLAADTEFLQAQHVRRPEFVYD